MIDRGDRSAFLKGSASAAPPCVNDAGEAGKEGAGGWTFPGPRDANLLELLEACQRRTDEELARLHPDREPLRGLLHGPPARASKGLRSTLCMATCGAFGGRTEDAVRTAAALELFHAAFRLHETVEGESDVHRGALPSEAAHGVSRALNAGSALHLQAMETVLGNLERLGLARTLALTHEILHMYREVLESQALELEWLQQTEVPVDDEAYVRLMTRKCGWYACVAPCQLGAIAAGHTRAHELDLLARAFLPMGVALQIQDDLLELVEGQAPHGRRTLGELLGNKSTVMLLHLLRTLPASARGQVREWLAMPRRQEESAGVRWLLALMEREGSIEHGRRMAARFAEEAAQRFEHELAFLPESEPKAVLRQVIHYARSREP